MSSITEDVRFGSSGYVGLIITIAARSDLAKDASRILIRLSQIFLINMAFAAYVLENAILLFSPGVAFARFFKAPP